MPIDSSTTVEVQLRTISRREGNFSKARNGLKEAVGILRARYQSLLFFAQSQQDSTQIDSDIDQFWTELQGEKLIDQAQEIILSLDTQLIMDQNIQTSLLPQHINDLVTTTATLAVADPSRQTTNLPSHENQDCPQQAPTRSSSQEVHSPILQPMQLRPIELPTFDGDTAQFHDFWCKFKTVVHDNDTLSLPTKFIYLSDSLKGSAALIVQGYDLSKPENYHLAIHALRRRYDRPQFTHNLFHHKLEQLQMSTSSASIQRDTLCQIQSLVSQINRYEDTSTSLSLMKLIRSKFPKETQLEVNRLEHRSGKIWTLSELLDGLNEVIEEYEKLDDYTIDKPSLEAHANPVSTTRSRSPTPELRKSDGREHSKCHAFRFKPPARDSSRPYPDEELSIRQAADSEDEYDQSSCHQHLNDPSATLVSTASDISTTSSLMTVEALALDQQTNYHVAVILLLDTGAQRSFISQSAVDRLHVTVSHITPLTTVAFGAVRTTEQSARPTGSPTILMVNGPIRMSSEANTSSIYAVLHSNDEVDVDAHTGDILPASATQTVRRNSMINPSLQIDSSSHSRSVQAFRQDTMKRSATSSSNPQSTKQPKPSGIPSAEYSLSASSSHTTSAPADRTVLSSATRLQGTPEHIQSDRTGTHSSLHPRRTDSIPSAPSRHSDRIRPPQELIAEYIADQPFTVENPSQDRSSTSSKNRSQQIVQSLTNAATLDHTFSMEHLATRDLVMVDAFVNHAFYITLREWLVEETPTPKEVRCDYPPVKDYSICAIIQSYKELHAATEKMRQFTNDLAAHPQYWQSEEKLVQLHDEHLTLLHDLQTNRSTLTDLILPRILNSIEDNRLFVDTLDYYTITLAQIKLVCAAATTETAFGFLNLKKIDSAIHAFVVPRQNNCYQPRPWIWKIFPLLLNTTPSSRGPNHRQVLLRSQLHPRSHQLIQLCLQLGLDPVNRHRDRRTYSSQSNRQAVQLDHQLRIAVLFVHVTEATLVVLVRPKRTAVQDADHREVHPEAVFENNSLKNLCLRTSHATSVERITTRLVVPPFEVLQQEPRK
ncbi:hypothetical protein TELCIR_19599 [Teladorsagia circumcincta]|uniref:Peptidase A2 domain-containing protein n=1 Tax=Teladorsagia circumcincta TaxID=45464 RepID=A0A2G9TNN2_TELCI|nr:hypothetical protein TELCIR_19599 [Teladorsagia circumcincta]